MEISPNSTICQAKWIPSKNHFVNGMRSRLLNLLPVYTLRLQNYTTRKTALMGVMVLPSFTSDWKSAYKIPKAGMFLEPLSNYFILR